MKCDNLTFMLNCFIVLGQCSVEENNGTECEEVIGSNEEIRKVTWPSTGSFSVYNFPFLFVWLAAILVSMDIPSQLVISSVK